MWIFSIYKIKEKHVKQKWIDVMIYQLTQKDELVVFIKYSDHKCQLFWADFLT